MKNFEFSTASKIIYGCGSVKQVGALSSSFGRRLLIIISKSASLKSIEDLLKSGFSKYEVYKVSGEPTYEAIENEIKTLRSIRPDVILAIGGGSTLDFAKVVSALMTNEGDLLDYLEVVGKNQPLVNSPIPMIAAPTTAGTGTEVTKNAVIKISDKAMKVSLRNEKLVPRIALIDPELTLDLPPQITASTGMDALVQLIEPFTSIKSNPFTDLFCIEGIKAISANLQKVYANPVDIQAREQMSFASLLGGLALANAGLGAVHGFAAVLGGMSPIPHGECCAGLLPAVFSANQKALLERDPQNPLLGKFDEISRLVTRHSKAKTSDGVKWFGALIKELKIPQISEYGITLADFPAIIDKVKSASSMKANPVQLTEEELNRILSESL